MQSRYRLIDYLIDNGVLEARGKDEQASVFIVERTEESSDESGEQTIRYQKQIYRQKYRWY